MASRTEAGSSSSLHPALSQGLSDGKVSQIEINGKIYLVFKVEGGQLADNPISRDVDLEKVKSVAKLVLDTHKAAAQSTPSLRDKEITHITDVGVRFGADDVQKHEDVNLRDHKPYLTTIKDLDWQQGVIDLERHLDGLEDDDVEMDVADLTRDFKAYLERNGLRDEKYPAYQINRCLLDYTCEKIRNTHSVDVQVDETETDDSIREWVDSFNNAEELINASNRTIQQHFTAQHVWQTFTNLFDPQPRVHHPLTDYDDDDETSSTSSSTRSSTSVSELEEDSDDDTYVSVSEHEERGRSRTRRRRDSNASSRSRSSSSEDKPSFGSKSPSPSSRRSHSAPPPRKKQTDVSPEHDDTVAPRGRSLSRSDSRESRSPSRSRSRSASPTPSHSRSPSRSPSPVPGIPPVSSISDLPFEHGIHLVEMPRSDAKGRRIDPRRTWNADRDDTSTYGAKPVGNEMHRSVVEGPRYQSWHELYRDLELKAMNTDPKQWDSQQDYQALLVSAEQKLTADSIDLTEKELSVVRQMIERRQSAGGFALLTNGQRYKTVLEDLKRYQGKRF